MATYENFEETGRKRGDYGEILNYQADDGTNNEFTIVNMPENVDENTPVVFLYSGNGGYDRNDYNAFYGDYDFLSDYVIRNDEPCDALVIGGIINKDDEIQASGNLNILEGLEKEFGINPENYNGIGFSRGYRCVVIVAEEMEKKYPNWKGVNVGIDPVYKSLDDPNCLQDNKFLFYGNGVDGASENFKYNYSSNHDITLIGDDIIYKTHKFPDGAGHGYKRSTFFSEGGINFITGLSDTFGELYGVDLGIERVITPKEITPEMMNDLTNELVNNIKGINDKYFGSGSEWKWNNDTLAGELQGLVSQVSGLGYIKNESSAGYSSTTELPNAEAEKQQLLYANVSALLLNVEQIIEAAYTIQDSIQVTEKTKAEEASELDNGKTTTTSGGPGLLGLFGAAVEKGKEWLEKGKELWGKAKDGLINIALKGLPFLTNPLISPSINSGARTFQRLLTLGLAALSGGKDNTTEIEEIPEKEPEKPEEETPVTPEPEKPSGNTGGGYHGGGGYYGGGSSGSGGTTPSPEVSTEEYDIKKDFPEWDDIYTDDNRLVYESEEGYKVVIHHDEEKITGVEHYYDFKTEESAKENYEKVINDYINEEYADVVIRKEQYIKMVYKEESYSEVSLSKFKDRFEDLKLVEKSS